MIKRRRKKKDNTLEIRIFKIAEADGICYECNKHVMKDCECFFGKLFISDQT